MQIYICTYAHTDAYIYIYTHTHTQIHIHHTHERTYVVTYVRGYVCTYIYVCMYRHTYAYIYIYIYTCVYECVCMYLHICVDIRMYMHRTMPLCVCTSCKGLLIGGPRTSLTLSASSPGCRSRDDRPPSENQTLLARTALDGIQIRRGRRQG